jgi:hypothetical protein
MRRFAILALGAAGVAMLAGTSVAPASCISNVTYLGAPFFGVSRIDAAEVAGPAGPGTIPVCNDVVFPDAPFPTVEKQPTPVTVHRIRGVAPRLGVAMPPSNGRTNLMVLFEGPCRIGTADRALACLRRETTRLVKGPSLIAPASAEAGAVIRVAVNVRDPRLRKNGVTGLDTLLQARVNGRWRSIFHVPHPLPDAERVPDPVAVGTPGHGVLLIGLALNRSYPLRLPDVGPGQYRLAKTWNADGREHTVVATITIR